MDTQFDPDSFAFVLRLWQERPATVAQPAVWRLSLTDARSGERRGFGSLEAVLAFLQAQMGTEQKSLIAISDESV